MTNPPRSRILSIVLILLGGLLLYLAPDDSWIGVVLALAGVAVELIAVLLRHRKNSR